MHIKNLYLITIILLSLILFTSCNTNNSDKIEFSKASILISPSIESSFKQTIENVLTEEIEKRTSLKIATSDDWGNSNLIALVLSSEKNLFKQKIPIRTDKNQPEFKKEGFRIFKESKRGKNIIWIIGNDNRGLFYGIGQLLRTATMEESFISFSQTLNIASSPEYPIRGHQFGYRNAANSWDAWTVEQFDQHLREQILFGANSFENIPFEKGAPSVHMKLSREEMGIHLSNICNKYDADYWVWTPARFDLADNTLRQLELNKHENFYKNCHRLDGIFFPGGDPGNNHPSEVLPFLKDLATILHKYHPKAGIWVSLQGFNEKKVNYFFNYLIENQPDWLTGLVNGPSSPSLKIEREKLPNKYKIRSYPDITHTVRCQHPVKNWDQAFALTLGRECTNPQPIYYSKIHNRDAIYTDGFISYSDGIHDDVNKIVWSQKGWNTNKDTGKILIEYCNFFFGSNVAEDAANAILSLEQNWEGLIKNNPVIEETLKKWQKLEKENPQLANNWRWQQLVMRAYYDAFIQKREAYEKQLEEEAYNLLSKAKDVGVKEAMELSLNHIQKADREMVAQELKEKVVQYCDNLFETIGLQTSVPKYNASGYERGCILDFIDYPLNNRWWLEDEFKKVDKMETEAEKLNHLNSIISYENPGEDSFYDNISSLKAKHVISDTDDAIDYLWEKNGFSRKRLSTQLFQFSPILSYHDLNPETNYLIRVSGFGEALLRANGVRLKPSKYKKGFGQFKEFPLPNNLIKDGKLEITFDKPDEEHLNWRKQSKITDVWILKQS